MGTRHIIMVVQDQKAVVAQYGQWDGYPDGQGTTVLEFLKDMNLQHFSERLKNCTFVTDDDVQALWAECGADGSGMVDMTVADKFNSKYPQLSRDMGGDILEHIHQSEGTVELQDTSDFVNESLHCEWAYVIDMDNGVFEVYEGFQTKPVPETNRFQSEGYLPYPECKETYYPVLLKQSWQLDELPNKDDFVAAFNEDE